MLSRVRFSAESASDGGLGVVAVVMRLENLFRSAAVLGGCPGGRPRTPDREGRTPSRTPALPVVDHILNICMITVLPSLHSKSPCTSAAAAHSARSKCASDSCPRHQDGDSSPHRGTCTLPPADS